jgi:hypothetical protein
MAQKLTTTLSLCLAGLCFFFATQPTSAAPAPINDCLIVAAKAQYGLNPLIWSRLLVVRYDSYRLQHVYLVYAVGTDEISSFDSIHGTRHFHTGARGASELARFIDPRATSGWFVEENTSNRTLFAQPR